MIELPLNSCGLLPTNVVVMNQPNPHWTLLSGLEWMLPGGRAASSRRGFPAGHVRPLGQAMVGLGVLVVLFTLYQLWGTGVVEWQAQRGLEAELATRLEAGRVDDYPSFDQAPTSPSPSATTAESTTVTSGVPPVFADQPPTAPAGPSLRPNLVPPPEQPPSVAKLTEGEAMARLSVPSIGLSKVVAQGVERETLRSGPGHYPTSALPGEAGNVAIAGHRTTHGSPFIDLDLVAAGDEITLETELGRFVYEVQANEGPNGPVGHRIVDPSAVEVIADHGDDRLTLTACHPKFSARQRIVVSAVLVSAPDRTAVGSSGAPAIPDAATAATPAPELPLTARAAANRATMASGSDAVAAAKAHPTTPGLAATGDGLNQELPDDSLGWQRSELDPTTLWATVFVLVAIGGWIAGQLVRRRAVYVATVPVAIVPLMFFYYHLERLLPVF